MDDDPRGAPVSEVPVTRELVVDAELLRRLGRALLRRTLANPGFLVPMAVVTLVMGVFGELLLGPFGPVFVAAFLCLALGSVTRATRRAAEVSYPVGSLVTASYSATAFTLSTAAGASTVPYARLRDVRARQGVVTAGDHDTSVVHLLPGGLVPGEALDLMRSGGPAALPASPEPLPLVFRPTAGTAATFAWAAWRAALGGSFAASIGIGIVVTLWGVVVGSAVPAVFLLIPAACLFGFIPLRRQLARMYPEGVEIRARVDGNALELDGPRSRSVLRWHALGEPRWYADCVVFQHPQTRQLVHVFPRQFFPVPPE